MPVVIVFAIATLAAAQTAHGGTIWIEWDRSPDPSVIGYRVSVGTAPGVYTETFDVGGQTAFVYQAREDNRVYYLAVAAYAPGPLVGPTSPAISASPRPVFFGPSPGDAPIADPGDVRSFYASLWRPPVTGHTAGRASGAGIGLMEDGQRMELMAGQVLQRPPVPDDPAVQLTQVLRDPSSGLLYAGEVVTTPGGEREFRIVRYRVTNDVADERTVMLVLPLSREGRAVLAFEATDDPARDLLVVVYDGAETSWMRVAPPR